MACCYCQRTHSSVGCPVMTSLDARRQFLKTSGRCFNCLVRGHIVRRCRSPTQCQACKRKHHPSIYDQTAAAEPKSPTSSSQPTNVAISTLNPEAPPYMLNPTSNTLSSTGAKSVLLQTPELCSTTPGILIRV